MATVDDPQAFAFITLKPWREKRGAYVGPYRMGWWPGERAVVAANYENPAGFIEVTPQNASTRLSAHFTLRDFLTHDQDRVWPKYVVLREALLDKLELVLSSMQAQGVPTENVRVLSGFRAPYYNSGLVAEGAARASRHQFGDASDIIIDNEFPRHRGDSASRRAGGADVSRARRRPGPLRRDGPERAVRAHRRARVARPVDPPWVGEAGGCSALCVEWPRSHTRRSCGRLLCDGRVGRPVRGRQVARPVGGARPPLPHVNSCRLHTAPATLDRDARRSLEVVFTV
jgi:hypothetical protein